MIGTAKSGSTTLFRWLDRHPGVGLPPMKEPHFFAHDEVWWRGEGWYRAVFSQVPSGLRTGEASVTYTDPSVAAKAAERLRGTLPEARLLCVLRHPIERLRSHYRHEVQRGRERRPFLEAIEARDRGYLERSCYAICLAPWVERFDTRQLLVIRLEDLVGDEGPTWTRVLRHLGVAPVPRPTGAFNVTSEKRQFTRPMRFLWEAGLIPRARRFPAPLRSLASRLLLRRGRHYAERLAESARELPPGLVEPVWADVARLPELLGDHRLRWPHDSAEGPIHQPPRGVTG